MCTRTAQTTSRGSIGEVRCPAMAPMAAPYMAGVGQVPGTPHASTHSRESKGVAWHACIHMAVTITVCIPCDISCTCPSGRQTSLRSVLQALHSLPTLHAVTNPWLRQLQSARPVFRTVNPCAAALRGRNEQAGAQSTSSACNEWAFDYLGEESYLQCYGYPHNMLNVAHASNSDDGITI